MLVDILILGAGWSSTFLIPLCSHKHITVASTSTSGRDDTFKFVFEGEGPVDLAQYKALPTAKSVIITFPITVEGGSKKLIEAYIKSRPEAVVNFIQLGTTSIWDGTRKAPKPVLPVPHKWYDRNSPYIKNPRSIAEEEFLSLSSEKTPTTVLNLSGLWGGDRSMRKYVNRVAPTKEVLRDKGSIHLIHGVDLARAIVAVYEQFPKAAGQRWLLTDGRIYDWWDLASAWGTSYVEDVAQQQQVLTSDHSFSSKGPHAEWVLELQRENSIRALPRNVELLGRALDSREFWETFGLTPVQARL